MAKTLLLLAGLSFFAVFPVRAEDAVALAYPNAPLEIIAVTYADLSGLETKELPAELRGSTCNVWTGDVKLSRDRAARYIEAALYTQGVEIVKTGKTTVEFRRFATFTRPESQPRRRVIRRISE